MKDKIMQTFKENSMYYFVFALAVAVSSFAGYYFIFTEPLSLAYFDANTRLNIARRIFDNLTPGLGQIGNVWPPFPQILMTPFVSSEMLWRTGLAGWIVSGISFIATALFIYKIVFLLTKNIPLSTVGAITFLFNINALYLQTTAMSESFFWLTLVASFYFMAKYLRGDGLPSLMLSGIAIIFCTLTRYEGYALFFGSIAIVFFSLICKKEKWSKVESNVVLYTVLASFGMTLWALYLWAIFGDPLYWLHYYADTQIPTDAAVATTKSFTIQTFGESIYIYLMSVMNMTGVVTTFFGILSFIYVLLVRSIKSEIKLLLLYPLFLLLFMILTLSRNTPIEQPFMSLDTLFDKSTNLIKEFNIRYGLSLLVYFVIFTMVMLNKIRYSIFIYLFFFAMQTVAYFYTPIYLTYQLRNTVSYGVPEYVPWLRGNYKNGLILMSAAKHDPEMIQLEMPYKTYIHEGTQYYWKESLQNPGKYATWIVFDRYIPSDPVAKKFRNKNMKEYGFAQVYKHEGVEVYKKGN